MSIVKIKVIIKRYIKINRFKIFCSTNAGIKLEQVHSVIQEFFMSDIASMKKFVNSQLHHTKIYFLAIQEQDDFLLPYFLQCQCNHSKIYRLRKKSNRSYLYDLYFKYFSCCTSSLRDVCDEVLFPAEMFSSCLLDCGICSSSIMSLSSEN